MLEGLFDGRRNNDRSCFQGGRVILALQRFVSCGKIAHLAQANAGGNGVVEDVSGVHQQDGFRRGDRGKFICRNMQPEIIPVDVNVDIVDLEMKASVGIAAEWTETFFGYGRSISELFGRKIKVNIAIEPEIGFRVIRGGLNAFHHSWMKTFR